MIGARQESSESLSRRGRALVQGPEADLLAEALATCSSLIRRQQLFEEPRLPTGFPDAVLVELSRGYSPITPARIALREEHLQLLHHVTRRGGVFTFTELAEQLLWRKRDIEAAAVSLAAAELVTCERGLLHARPSREVFAARRIVAVEAKVRDWRSALNQAVANTWFASHSLILMPAARVRSAVMDAARAWGIGILAFDGARLAIPVRPRANPIPCSYGSWVLSERALSNTSARVLTEWASKRR